MKFSAFKRHHLRRDIHMSNFTTVINWDYRHLIPIPILIRK